MNPNAAPVPERALDTTTSKHRYRVRGPMPTDAVVNAKPGTTFVRTSFDHRSRAVLEVGELGYLVRYQAFRKTSWEWAETPHVRRAFAPNAGEAACRYFNSLALSPGYKGSIGLDLESEAS